MSNSLFTYIPKNTMKKIKGTIEYTLTVDESGCDIEYNSTIDNDIASLAIAHRVMGVYEEKFREDKKNATGSFKQSISAYLDKCIKAKFALVSMFNYAFGVYEEYYKAVDKKITDFAESLQKTKGNE